MAKMNPGELRKKLPTKKSLRDTKRRGAKRIITMRVDYKTYTCKVN